MFSEIKLDIAQFDDNRHRPLAHYAIVGLQGGYQRLNGILRLFVDDGAIDFPVGRDRRTASSHRLRMSI
jgi:hypothetical protein